MKESTKTRIAQIMEEAIAQEWTAGVNTLILKDGEEIFFAGRGWASLEQRKPFTRDGIVRLFSMSKPVTAAAAMILMQQGRLDLSAKVSEFLPEFEDIFILENEKPVKPVTPMTVFHLLNMTAGLTYGDMDTPEGRQVLSYIARCQSAMHGPDAVSTRDFAAGLARLPLAYEPDTSWSYGLCADVLGAVIEVVSGMSLGDFLRENIFSPLGMEDTGFYVPAEKQSRLADACLTVAPGQIRPFTKDNLVISYKMKKSPAFESGGAGLVSTIDDYARFAQMLLFNGELDGVRILDPKTVSYMTGGRLTPPQQKAMRRWVGLEGFTYCNLMRVRDERLGCYSGLSSPGEYGWDGWMGCYFANFPSDNVTLVITQQKAESGTTPMIKKIRNVLLTDEEVFA